MTTDPTDPAAADDSAADDSAPDDSLARLGRQIELLAASVDVDRAGSADDLFDRAAVLRDNAMGIIYDGDGSTEQERVGRLIALVPALLHVVDEARDTIERLREVAAERDAPKLVSPYDAAGKGEPGRPTWGS